MLAEEKDSQSGTSMRWHLKNSCVQINIRAKLRRLLSTVGASDEKRYFAMAAGDFVGGEWV